MSDRKTVRARVEAFQYGGGGGSVAIRFVVPDWTFRMPRIENYSVLYGEMTTHAAALRAAAEAWATAMGYAVEWEDVREARDQLREATKKVSALLASDKPVPEILVGLAEIGQEQAEAEARKKAEMDAIFADCGPSADALAYLRKGLTPEQLGAIEAEVEHLKAAPDFDELERLLGVAAKYAPLPWRMTAPGCMADANEAAIRQDCDALIVAAVNALPWLMREVEGGEG